MKIAVTGGKGGTGKSTVATALAVHLAKKYKVLLIDADVDCPNDDLILGIKLRKVKDVKSMIPKFDTNKCIKCGKCSKICRENAIVFVKGKNPILVPDQCTGCRACKIACPVGAISESKQIIGEIHEGKSRDINIKLVTGKLKPGIEESSLVVNAIKKHVKQEERNYDFVIIDTAAGTHCPVISALFGVDLGLSVTEPTPLGKHDLELILKLMSELKIKSKVVLNRCNIANKKEMERTTKKYSTEIIAEIPYSKKIQELYSKGIPIKHVAIEKIARELNP